MAKNPNKKFKHMLSSHVKRVGNKKQAPKASPEEMKEIEAKAPAKTHKSRDLWTEYAISARPVLGGAPGLKSQKRR